MIYLVKSAHANPNKVYYKIGFTNNLEQRLKAYITANPTIEIVETIQTYRKTKRALETSLHNALKALGYEFKSTYGVETEWFAVDKSRKFSLEQFKETKNRKIIQARRE